MVTRKGPVLVQKMVRRIDSPVKIIEAFHHGGKNVKTVTLDVDQRRMKSSVLQS